MTLATASKTPLSQANHMLAKFGLTSFFVPPAPSIVYEFDGHRALRRVKPMVAVRQSTQRDSPWANPDTVTALIRYAETKTMTAQQITEMLCETIPDCRNLTRGAVLGKCFRLNISIAKQPAKPKPKASRAPKIRATPAVKSTRQNLSPRNPPKQRLPRPKHYGHGREQDFILPQPIRTGTLPPNAPGDEINQTQTNRLYARTACTMLTQFHLDYLAAKHAETLPLPSPSEQLSLYWPNSSPVECDEQADDGCLYPTVIDTKRNRQMFCSGTKERNKPYCTMHNMISRS